MPEEEKKTEEKKPEEKKPKEKKPKEKKPVKAPVKKKGWFQKIPADVILSPGGVVLIIFALVMEILDLLPIPPPVDQILEIPLELIFMFFLVIIAKVSFKSLIIPFLIERIPVISDVLPTWVIRMLV